MGRRIEQHEIHRLTELGFSGEVRGPQHEEGIEPLPSLRHEPPMPALRDDAK